MNSSILMLESSATVKEVGPGVDNVKEGEMCVVIGGGPIGILIARLYEHPDGWMIPWRNSPDPTG